MAASDNGKVHSSDQMTSRERLLGAYRREPLDRLPYWAKVTNDTWRSSQPEHVRRWSDRELLDYIRADGIFGIGRCVRTASPRIRVEDRLRDNVRTRVTHTPDGELAEQWTMDPCTRSWHPTVFPVKTRDDLERCRWLYCERRITVNAEALDAAASRAEQIGQRGITKVGWGTSPLMDLIQHVIGPAGTVYFLADCPSQMEELMALMHEANLALVACLAERTPADLVVSVENTSTTLLSPRLFQTYCYRHLCEYGRLIERAGKIHELHMCGTLLDLLEEIDGIPAAAIEAFSAPPLGNTRLADGKALAASKTLVGGTCVNVWWRSTPAQIERFILDELAACADDLGIVLTTAGVAPPACSVETFRAVGQWIASVPFRPGAGQQRAAAGADRA